MLQASGIFIAGDKRSLSTSELCSFIAKALSKRILLIKIPDLLIRTIRKITPSVIDRLFGSMELDNRKTNEVLGLKLPFTTEEGIKNMVEWYKTEAVS
ncbi:MAG: hypothetical protein IPJ37_03885 [Bacteroidales bacterium]|nr:hypothetical protein [Bacteroidales bacterium]